MSWKDTALDLVLGKSDWEQAAEGYAANDWGDLLSGAAMGALALASVAPVGGVGKAARAGLSAAAREGVESGVSSRAADLLDPGSLGGGLGRARVVEPVAAPASVDDVIKPKDRGQDISKGFRDRFHVEEKKGKHELMQRKMLEAAAGLAKPLRARLGSFSAATGIPLAALLDRMAEEGLDDEGFEFDDFEEALEDFLPEPDDDEMIAYASVTA